MTGESNLSEREIEILGLVTEGLTNREIAQRLSISHNTVKVHLSNVFEKIGVSSRTEATVYAIEHRIVDVPGGVEQDTATQAEQLRNIFRRYIWLWVPIAVLIVLGIIVLRNNLIASDSSQTSLPSSIGSERWQEFKPMPEPRAGLTAVVYDGDIYAVGGEGPEGVSGSVFRYLVEEDRWETLNNKPTPVMAAKGILISEKIYIPGGKAENAAPTDILEIYDIRQDSWESGSPLPGPISDYALIGYQGELFLFGGWDGEDVIDSVWIYNPDTRVWRKGSSMQTPRKNAAGFEIGGKLLIIGGTDGQKQITPIEVYSPERDIDGEVAWNNEGEIPNGVEVYAVQTLANFVFVIGKLAPEENIILNYDVINDSWHYSYRDIIYPIFLDAAMSTSGEELIFLGGRNDAGELQSDHWHYTAVYTISVPLITQ